MSKRNADTAPTEVASGPAKKARISKSGKLSVADIAALDTATVEALSKEELVQHLIHLQAGYLELQAASAKAPLSSSSGNNAPVTEDPAEIRKKAAKLASMMSSGIEKQMKWQPSCKRGGKRWSYTAMVPSEAVFYKLFNLKEEKKAWKQKKIPLGEFEKITGELSASIRYGYLTVVSKEITLKWDKDANSFTVSGLYGL